MQLYNKTQQNSAIYKIIKAFKYWLRYQRNRYLVSTICSATSLILDKYMSLPSLQEEIQEELQFTNEQFQEVIYQIQKIDGFKIILPQMLRNILERIKNYHDKYQQQTHIQFSDLYKLKNRYIKENNYFINELNDVKMLCKSIQMNYNHDQLSQEIDFLVQQLQYLIEGISAVIELYSQMSININDQQFGKYENQINNENFLKQQPSGNQLSKTVQHNVFQATQHDKLQMNDQQGEFSTQSSEISAHFSNIYQNKKRDVQKGDDQEKKNILEKSGKSQDNLIDSAQYALESGPNGGRNKVREDENEYVLGSQVNAAYVKTTNAIVGQGRDALVSEIRQRFTELGTYFKGELNRLDDGLKKNIEITKKLEKQQETLETKCARQESTINDLKRQLEAITSQYTELTTRIVQQDEFIKKLISKQIDKELAEDESSDENKQENE